MGGGQMGGGRGRGRMSRDMELIGQTVRISQGPYKGKRELSDDNITELLSER